MVKAMAEIDGPCYIRVNRNDVPVVTGENDEFVFGKVREMKDGKDVVIFATGFMVYQSLEAAKLLEAEGISAKVVNVNTIKPFDAEGVIAAAKGMKAAVTVEEASVIGGLGEAVCACLSEHCPTPVKRIGVNDEFGHSGPAADLLKDFGLSAENIVKTVKEWK